MKTLYTALITCALLFTTSQIMAKDTLTKILVLIHSDTGGTYKMAQKIAKGIESNPHTEATIKLVQPSENALLSNLQIATPEELPTYDGIVWGSPVYFGNISTPMSAFLAKTVDLWTAHTLEGMPTAVFMSAGSGAGKELALQSFWNNLAVHGMILVSNGIRAMDKLDKSIPQGNSVLGASSLASNKAVVRPSESELLVAYEQGMNFAKVATALKGTFNKTEITIAKQPTTDIKTTLKQKNIILPTAPNPVGNYTPYSRSGNLVFINQVALKEGKVLYPGKVGVDVTEEEAKKATEQTMLNVIAVLKLAVNGDLNRVKKTVQLTGIFNTTTDYTQHANLMNVASDLSVAIFGDKGKHARGTLGASSIPVNSPVEIQAIFEVE
ncbi:NAD(P)H-dependent oxidoreductase [Myroides sp. M-43]|uniref:Atu1372/SO_1960 family protein n=1 Tax=Myroides oncorhynchi TaxID=2893756 RepID=UPI001E3CB429|nr:Atu1372/SO_1960 family protein [Myroides oncorhynchi]MCC9042106.1 NAD(P)H-dependent oxidoreductase [Myroides oncorhynchi]